MKVGIKASVHDRTQIELDFDYCTLVEGTGVGAGIKKEGCGIDFYFFIPNSFGINSGTYSRDQFYNDLTNHIRLHTPVTSGSLLDPLNSLKEYFSSTTLASRKAELVPLVCQQIKYFGNSVNHRLKSIHLSITKLCSDANEAADNAASRSFMSDSAYKFEAEELSDEIEKVRSLYIEQVRDPSLTVDAKVRKALLVVDEYVVNRVISAYSSLVQNCFKSDVSKVPLLKSSILNILIKEHRYRQHHGNLYVGKRKDTIEQEYFYYRHNLLKKYVSRPLYIQKKSFKQERIYRNWLAGMGAALAGLWAQIADYQAHRMAHKGDLGLSFVGVALIAILIYVFKDRIKDLSKEYFNEKLKAYLPDFKVVLFHELITPSVKPKKVPLGSYQEFVRFLDSPSIPAEVQFIRKLTGRRDIGEEHLERIIHYNRKIKLDFNNLKKTVAGATATKDILRFNFSSFLDHLDDNLKSLSFYDENEGVGEVRAPRVYHLNLIVQVATKTRNQFAHFRIILDKIGIVRLEKIGDPDSLSYVLKAVNEIEG